MRLSKRSRGSNEPISRPGKTLSPNRTSDESPSDEVGRANDLRDPLRAPGQLPRFARRKISLDADESYGNTEIPRGVEIESDTKTVTASKARRPAIGQVPQKRGKKS
jgi:hypothetical protein